MTFRPNNDVMIPFNKPYRARNEEQYISKALASHRRQGGGQFTEACHEWLQDYLKVGAVFLTQSCTAALEMTALLADIRTGDEVIVPSFTFTSTASAFALQGGVPVFVDVSPDTQCIDPDRVVAAITKKTRAIVAVHYAGVGCDMEALSKIAQDHKLILIEDAAQALCSNHDGKPLGTFGDLAAFSFHDTKNISCGEGGALIVNNPEFVDRAEILWEKGTNRRSLLRGEIDKYSWTDLGSSFLPSEITSAFLLAQLEEAHETTRRRRAAWKMYQRLFDNLPVNVSAMAIPDSADHNAHIAYLLLDSKSRRDDFIQNMKCRGVETPFHYVPLHSSEAGLKLGRVSGSMEGTERAGDGLVRLPMYNDIKPADIEFVIDAVFSVL